MRPSTSSSVDSVEEYMSEPLKVPASPRSPTTTFVASPTTTPCSACYTENRRQQGPDVNKDLSRPLHGWPKLAKQISDYPDFEAFPAYRDLNIKSLLYYQAELDWLKRKLHDLEWRDHQQGQFEGAEKLGERFDTLLLCGDDDDPRAQKQWKLMKQIRVVLKEYNEALLQYSQITALPKADHFNVDSLRKWLSADENRNINGPGAETWGCLTMTKPDSKSVPRRFLSLLRNIVWPKKAEKSKLDLIVPRAGHEYDGLTRWVANEFVPFWQCVLDAFRNIGKATVNNNDEEAVSSAVSEKESGNSGSETEHKQRKWICFPWTKNLELEDDEEGRFEDASEYQPLTLNTYTEDRMVRFTSFVATVIACLLPTVAIAVLAKLHTMASILGLIAVFTAVFAIGLMFLTNAGTSRVEIFTATAAFSAVMVVFVQNQNGGTTNLSGVVLNITGTAG